MELIKNQQPDAFQRRVFLQAAGQNAFGDHFDARGGADFAVQTDAITHGFADFLTQFAGQSLGGSPRCQASRLQHHDALTGQPWLIQQGQRHTGSFTGAGRCFEHRFVALTQGLTQCR